VQVIEADSTGRRKVPEQRLPSGKRQIFSFHIPGDIPDLQTLHLQVMDHNVGTLVLSKVAFISHETVRAFLRAHLRIADVFWRDTLIDAAIYREWMAGIGRRDAHARIAHLLCELFLRLKAVGLTHGDAYEMPITQAELADLLGLSTVHVNRTLQQLRGSGIISTSREKVVIRNWNKLQEAGEFDRNSVPYAPKPTFFVGKLAAYVGNHTRVNSLSLGGVAVLPCPHQKNTGNMPSNAWNSPRKPKTSTSNPL
jgi:CRP-like cAMP-binding protein